MNVRALMGTVHHFKFQKKHGLWNPPVGQTPRSMPSTGFIPFDADTLCCKLVLRGIESIPIAAKIPCNALTCSVGRGVAHGGSHFHDSVRKSIYQDAEQDLGWQSIASGLQIQCAHARIKLNLEYPCGWIVGNVPVAIRLCLLGMP